MKRKGEKLVQLFSNVANSGCDLSYGDHSGRVLRRSSDPAKSADNELGQMSGSVINLPDSVPVTISLGIKRHYLI